MCALKFTSGSRLFRMTVRNEKKGRAVSTAIPWSGTEVPATHDVAPVPSTNVSKSKTIVCPELQFRVLLFRMIVKDKKVELCSILHISGPALKRCIERCRNVPATQKKNSHSFRTGAMYESI